MSLDGNRAPHLGLGCFRTLGGVCAVDWAPQSSATASEILRRLRGAVRLAVVSASLTATGPLLSRSPISGRCLGAAVFDLAAQGVVAPPRASPVTPPPSPRTSPVHIDATNVLYPLARLTTPRIPSYTSPPRQPLRLDTQVRLSRKLSPSSPLLSSPPCRRRFCRVCLMCWAGATSSHGPAPSGRRPYSTGGGRGQRASLTPHHTTSPTPTPQCHTSRISATAHPLPSCVWCGVLAGGSVTGLSFEFLAYNLTGFILYSTYSTISQPHHSAQRAAARRPPADCILPSLCAIAAVVYPRLSSLTSPVSLLCLLLPVLRCRVLHTQRSVASARAAPPATLDGLQPISLSSPSFSRTLSHHSPASLTVCLCVVLRCCRRCGWS